MYNAHRGMVPNPGTNRFNEILDQVRGEFDLQIAKSGEYEHKYMGQIQEMELMQRSVFQLETAHNQMKAKYEDEIARLTRELEARGGHVPSHGGGQNAGPSQPQPPAIGHGVGSLFGGIMSGQGPNGPGLAPPVPQEHQQQQSHVQHQPIHAPPPIQQGPLPQQPPQQYQPGFGAPSNGYDSQRPPPQPTASPGAGNRKRPLGPATPQQQPPAPTASYSNSQVSPSQSTLTRPSPAPIGNNLGDVDPSAIPAHQKKEGADWFVYFNPRVQRVLDVDLVHTLDHNSVVCCVRFSQDGKFVATGCNRSAQIFDVVTGRRVTILQDDTVDREGDLYIRSVCFSPDGRYLATGAEDKQIRVWDIAAKTIKHNFVGHDQDIYSLDFSRNGRHIASGSGDRTVRLWDMDTGSQILTLSIEDGVTTVAISPDGRFVAAGSLDKSVRVWDASNGALVERLEGPDGHKDSVYSVAFAPNGRDLVSGSLDKTIKMWELSAGRGAGSAPRGGNCIRTFDGHRDFVLSVALTPDGKWVLSGSKDRGVQFWDPLTGSTQLMLQGHKNSVISVAPSPTGRLFATGSGDMRARIWSYDPHHPRDLNI